MKTPITAEGLAAMLKSKQFLAETRNNDHPTWKRETDTGFLTVVYIASSGLVLIRDDYQNSEANISTTFPLEAVTGFIDGLL